ncbi:CPBP family glutamic-type intramembrane protease [Massilia sp. SR12]
MMILFMGKESIAPDRLLQLDALYVIGVIFVAPLIETVILRYALPWLARKMGGVNRATLAAALAAGVLHGITDWKHFFAPFWVFGVCAFSFYSQEKNGADRAFLAALIPHAFTNACALFFLS